MITKAIIFIQFSRATIKILALDRYYKDKSQKKSIVVGKITIVISRQLGFKTIEFISQII